MNRHLVLLGGLWTSVAIAQTQPDVLPRRDTLRATELDTVVVTPERSATTVHASTVALSVIRGSLVRQLPVRSVAAALVLAPGVAVIDANSMGGSPRVVVRGFYGGGETDYLPALIDGVPVAALGSGAVDWDMLARSGIGRLEIVRGGSSYIRGDAALAGAVNLVSDNFSPFTWRLAGGNRNLRDATIWARRERGNANLDLALDHQASDGYRVHEQRRASTLSAKFGLGGPTRAISIFGSSHAREFDDPGPLLTTTTDRRAANQFFRFDQTTEKLHRVGVNIMQAFGQATASGYLVGEYATGNQVRTLPLSPDFGDTKQRRSEAPRVLASTQFELGDDSPGWRGHMLAGVDASLGRLRSRYADVASGTEADYAAASGDPGPLGPRSTARRETLAGFIYWQVRPASPVRVSVSSRLDHLHDTFRPSASGAATVTAAHQAISPRAAVNVALPTPAGSATNLYVSLSRVFKAPTLDQLFDERTIPIPFPPFSATVSNPSLVPQRGTAAEAGFFETWRVGSASRLGISGAAYRERMRDELDFDVATFRYINIGRSLHRGIELGSTLTGDAGWLVTANIARQQVLAEAGQFDGKQLKAIPRRIASAAASIPLGHGFTAGLLATSLGGAFIDDENTRPLPGYTRIDARLGLPLGRVRLTFDAMNALDRRYDATAFPDPAGSGVNYRYPAAGRVYVIGLESR
ncbi:MAG: TonB-dependent receptor [Gemmatimonadaceae bacterium]